MKPPAWGLGEGQMTSPKKQLVMKCYTGPRNRTDSLGRDVDNGKWI